MKHLVQDFENLLFYLLVFLLPTQFGLHFWPDFSKVVGIRIDYLSPTIYVTDVLVVLLFGVWMFKKLQTSNFKLQISKKSKTELLFVVLLLYLILNITLSAFVPGGFYFIWKFLEISFVAFYIKNKISTKKQFKKILWTLSLSAFFQSILAIAQFTKQGSVGGFLYFFGERTFTGGTPGIANASLNGELVLRPYGTLSHPNVLAGFLLIVMILLLFSFFGKNNKIKSTNSQWLITGCLAISSIALFLTMSRIAIVVWFLVLGYWFLVRFRKVKQRTAGVMLFTLIILFSLSTNIGTRFIELSPSSESVVQRQILIEKSWEMIKNNPLFGVGFGNFIPTLAGLQDRLTLSTYLQPVHNIFILVAAETGIIGFGFFIYFFKKTFEYILKRRQMLFAGVLSMILIIGLFDHYFITLQQGQLLLALIMGLSWSQLKTIKI